MRNDADICTCCHRQRSNTVKNEKKDSYWIPKQMYCPNCGTLSIGYQREGLTEFECSRCLTVFVRSYTNFVRKNMFDISDIKDPEPDVQPTYTAAEAVQGLFAHKAVDVRMIPDYPSDRQFGAFYDAEGNCVYAKRGMGYEQIFTDVAVALAHAEMAKDIEGYLPAEHQFEARCAAYVLAKKYGVPTKAVEIDRVPEEYGVMDAAGIRENLARIHDSVKNISSGMYKALVKEKEQEVSPKEKSGKGGDAR